MSSSARALEITIAFFFFDTKKSPDVESTFLYKPKTSFSVSGLIPTITTPVFLLAVAAIAETFNLLVTALTPSIFDISANLSSVDVMVFFTSKLSAKFG